MNILSTFIARCLAPEDSVSAWHLRPPHSDHFYETVSRWKKYVVRHHGLSVEIAEALEIIRNKPVHTMMPKQLAEFHWDIIDSTVKVQSEGIAVDSDIECVRFSSPVRRSDSGRFSLYVQKGSKINFDNHVYKVHSGYSNERLIPFKGERVKRFKGDELSNKIIQFFRDRTTMSFEHWLNNSQNYS